VDINYEGPLAPHRQIAAWLRERIEAGEFPPGRRIPSETEIVQETGVARTTARRAIKLLRDEGVIYTVAARGSFVATREGGQG
jgi:DNA-binding GntR family transcriptional regulator